MAIDIIAYFDVDQEKIEKYIVENNIDRNNYSAREKIIDYYKKHIIYDDLEHVGKSFFIYLWDNQLKIHKIFAIKAVKFIRDDSRFNDIYYKNMLEKKHGKPFPFCLQNILYSLKTVKQANEVADQLCIFFADDYKLMNFEKWLRETAKYCIGYELSY